MLKTTFYTPKDNSELSKLLVQIHLAMKRGETTFNHLGTEYKIKKTSKGTEYFALSSAIEADILVFKSQTDSGNYISIRAALESRNSDKIIIRGQVKDRQNGSIGSFFFDPKEDGYKAGYSQAKLEMVAKGIDPKLIFSPDELDQMKFNRVISEEQYTKLVKEIL